MPTHDGRVLAEKRKLTKTLAPGVVALPGGHMHAGESAEDTLRRELDEELGVAATAVDYVCTLLHRAEERKIHDFVVTAWRGEIVNREAEALVWIALDESKRLDLEIDRAAIAEYLRLRREGVIGAP